MSGEDNIEKWQRENRQKELQPSPSCSSFELLDPHDPVISRKATVLFKRTKEYLQGEMAVGQDYYTLLEEINRTAITKYADLRNLSVNLSKSLNEYNEMYNDVIKPMLVQIDEIDAQVTKYEASVFRLDYYTKQLRARFKELKQNNS